jgi:hypothetical protein
VAAESPSAAAPSPAQKLLAEGLGTALLLCVVIGSGIMAERLAGGNMAIALLANALATVGGLYVFIEVLGPVSGAHFNPAVSLAMAVRGALPRPLLLPYIAVQLLGAVLGAWLAHAMFDQGILQISTKLRSGGGQWLCRSKPYDTDLRAQLRRFARRLCRRGDLTFSSPPSAIAYKTGHARSAFMRPPMARNGGRCRGRFRAMCIWRSRCCSSGAR